MRLGRDNSSRPDAGDGFSTILALSGLHADFPDHISCPLDDLFFAFRAEGIFPLVSRDVSHIDIFKSRG